MLGSMMHSTSVSLIVLIFLVAMPVALAQCEATKCTLCIEQFGCVWTVAGACQEGCDSFPNIDCYYERFFRTTTADDSPSFTTAQVCDAWANNVTDNEACYQSKTANDCLKMAGCDWKMGVIENGENRNWCALNLNYAPETLPCSATTCNDCLAGPLCTWWKDGTCTNSCDGRPNIECFDALTFGVADAAAICEVYNGNETMAANEVCFNQTSKDGCFGESGCSWIASSAEAGTGHCTLSLMSTTNGDGSSGGRSTVSGGFCLILTTWFVFLLVAQL
jgi:hypothetical protein